MFRLPHTRRGGSQGPETFLGPSANKQTGELGNYNTIILTVSNCNYNRSEFDQYPYSIRAECVSQYVLELFRRNGALFLVV